jgi:uncharacterized protein involved in exopolysaccharide biosynthesis
MTIENDQGGTPGWVVNSNLLWDKRRTLALIAVASLVLALVVAFLWPKQYESSARIMPPSTSGGGAALLAAITGRSGGGLSGLGALASEMFASGGSTPLFMELLHSGTISGRLIERFDLQRVYHKRYRIDTAKYLARHTKVMDDKKSGIITLTVTDTDPVRARDIAQAYLEELNLLVNRTNTSSAHQERIFIEKRLRSVKVDLEQAQQRLSEFSSTHSTVDIKEQTRAMVDAASHLEAQLIVEQSGLESLKQIYGDGNIRVREAQARIAVVREEISKLGGSSEALPLGEQDGLKLPVNSPGSNAEKEYPALRQMPRLAVPYARLYREVQVQETVFELLTQQYELSRIQEAKDVPVVNIIDAPGVAEKKSFPPRLLMTLFLTVAAIVLSCAVILFHHQWLLVSPQDPRKILVHRIAGSLIRPGWQGWMRPKVRGEVQS